MEAKTLGQIAYEAMLRACNSQWPGWEGITLEHQGHWEAVVLVVLAAAESARGVELRDVSKVMKFRKGPIVIEAYQTFVPVVIETPEGALQALIGDWIITGVKGEKYPCKPDIFEATYEAVE